jgi:hypothetical protein
MKQSTELNFSDDIHPSEEQFENHAHQLAVHITNILLAAHPEFGQTIKQAPSIQFRTQQVHSKHKTAEYPLQTTKISESSISGNIKVAENLFFDQLQCTDSEILATPTFNDRLTNDYVWKAQMIQKMDVGPL